MKETTYIRVCVYSPVPENGNGEIACAYTRPYQKTGTGKLKRNGNMYGMVRSVHRPFNYRSIPVCCCVFFKRAPIVRIERGTFLMPTVCPHSIPFGPFHPIRPHSIPSGPFHSICPHSIPSVPVLFLSMVFFCRLKSIITATM